MNTAKPVASYSTTTDTMICHITVGGIADNVLEAHYRDKSRDEVNAVTGDTCLNYCGGIDQFMTNHF